MRQNTAFEEVQVSILIENFKPIGPDCPHIALKSALLGLVKPLFYSGASKRMMQVILPFS